jgi:hypothetical protein
MSITPPIYHPPTSGPTDSVFHFVGPQDPAEGGAARPVMPGMYWLDNRGVRLRLRRRSENNREWVEVAGAFPVDTGSVNMEFDPVSGNLFAFVIPEGVDHTKLFGRSADSHPQYLLRTDFPHTHIHHDLTGLTVDDHPQYVPKSLIDVKGDLLVGSSSDTIVRLQAGQDRQYLRSDSTKSEGLGWSYPPLDVTLGPYFASKVSSNTTSEMLLNYFSGPNTVALGPSGTNDYVMPNAGQVMAGFLNTDSPRTAGTMELRLRHNGSIKPWGGLVALNATNPSYDSGMLVPGFDFSVGDRIGVVVVTQGFSPTNNDVRASVVVRLFVT